MLEEQQNEVQKDEIDIEKMPPFKRFPIIKDWLYRLILFVVGLLGLDLIGTIIILILVAINPEYLKEESAIYVQGNMIVNSIRYSIIILIFAALLLPRLGVIFKKFKNWKTDLIGVGMGAAVLLTGFLYNLIIQQFINPGVNDNQALAVQMIKNFPVISFIVLGIFGPVSEEITYRYGLFEFVGKKNKILAYIVTILVFSLIHFNFQGNMTVELLNLPSYVIAGFLLTFTYHKFGFNASVIAHIVNNLYAVVEAIVSK